MSNLFDGDCLGFITGTCPYESCDQAKRNYNQNCTIKPCKFLKDESEYPNIFIYCEKNLKYVDLWKDCVKCQQENKINKRRN